ncbi:MAG: hypothetical protein ACYS3N_13705 [Planctomycetota bacterium]
MQTDERLVLLTVYLARENANCRRLDLGFRGRYHPYRSGRRKAGPSESVKRGSRRGCVAEMGGKCVFLRLWKESHKMASSQGDLRKGLRPQGKAPRKDPTKA